MARCQPVVSSVSWSLRDLLKEGVEYMWPSEAGKAFNNIKCSITTASVLSSFDPNKETTIQSGASLSGLGCSLIQVDKPVFYASRTLTKPEPGTLTYIENY